MKAVPLTKGLFALVDEEDFDKVSAFKWCASLESRGTKYYAVRWDYSVKPAQKVRMHRFVLGLGAFAKDGVVVDHLNDDSLDNRKENLKLCRQDENVARIEKWRRKKNLPC